MVSVSVVLTPPSRQEYKEDGYEDEDEAPAEEVPLTLTNVEDFLKFFPELTDYQVHLLNSLVGIFNLKILFDFKQPPL